MTNKMPEVGSKWRKICEHDVEIEICDIDDEIQQVIYFLPEQPHSDLLEDFLNDFEELPSSLGEEPEPQESEEVQVSEVEKAKEELKRHLLLEIQDLKRDDVIKYFPTVYDLAQALVDALDAEKKPQDDINVGQPESIWKPVSELPMEAKIIWRTRDGESDIFCTTCWPNEGVLLKSNHNSTCFKVTTGTFCTFTDFINSLESEKQARIDLEERVRKLEEGK